MFFYSILKFKIYGEMEKCYVIFNPYKDDIAEL